MWFSKKRTGASAALVHMDAASVAGGFVHVEEGKLPILCYAIRIPYEQNTPPYEAIERALATLGDRLAKEGVPALRGVNKTGAVDRVIVGLGTPWQEASVSSRNVQRPEPFVFTRQIEREALEEDGAGRRSVIATFLNGYQTHDPYGKRASRAELLILSSRLDGRVVAGVEAMLASSLQMRDATYVSFAESCYGAMRTLYPHEKDLLVLSIEPDAIEAASIKRGYLLDTGALTCGARTLMNGGDCLEKLIELMRGFATRHALPRTLFIKGNSADQELLRKALEEPRLRALWLSDEPITALSLNAAQFSGTLKTTGASEGDVGLAMLALSAVS